jgi:hypothetical protein
MRADETIFTNQRNLPETDGRVSSLRVRTGIGVRTSSMVEAAAALLALFSAGIFVAHMVEAYHAR